MPVYWRPTAPIEVYDGVCSISSFQTLSKLKYMQFNDWSSVASFVPLEVGESTRVQWYWSLIYFMMCTVPQATCDNVNVEKCCRRFKRSGTHARSLASNSADRTRRRCVFWVSISSFQTLSKLKYMLELNSKPETKDNKPHGRSVGSDVALGPWPVLRSRRRFWMFCAAPMYVTEGCRSETRI